MSEKERIIKLVWSVKHIKGCPFKCMNEYTEKDILSKVNEAYEVEKKGKADKVDIITAISQKDGEVKYKHYTYDSKNEFTYGDCVVNISVKNKNNSKALTFEEKLGLLESWCRKRGKIPSNGDMENDFDVGKFYNQSVTSVNKLGNVITAVEQYINTDE